MKEKKHLNKLVIIGSIVCSLILLGVLGSYAYFMGNLGLYKNEEISTETGSMSLIFSDGNNGIVGGFLEFGGSIEKTFNIQNNGTLNTTVKINWDNLTNTYLNGSLTYTLSYAETPDGEYTELITNKNVPRSETPETLELARNITIPENTTYYYKLKITLNYLDDVDQTADLKAMLSTQFSIEEQEQNVLMTRPSANYNEKIWAHKADIKTIVFEPSITEKPKTAYSYDISQNENGRVMGKLVPDTTDVTKYTLYIQADKKIYASENSLNLFRDFTSLEEIEGMEYFDTSNVIDISLMFYECNKLTALDLSNFDTSNVTNMQSMFYGCDRLTSLNLSNFDTSNVINMDLMFSGCSALTTLDLSNFDTSNVTSMGAMFNACSSLTTLDVSNFNTSNVTSMYSMFQNCSSLTSLYVGHFDTGKVIFMYNMFNRCSNLNTLDISNFDTSNVTNMSGMFNACSSLTLLDISTFDTSNVTNMNNMFLDCNNLSTTITIRGTACNAYFRVFANSATNSGASITVNYTADASTLVNNMIATKSSNSNVKKGVQVA